MREALLAAVLLAAAAAQDSHPSPSSAPASRPAPKVEELLAITNADVETVTMGRLRGATVVTKGSKIWKVGRNVEVPAAAKRIDGTGLRVYPGLVAARAAGIGLLGFFGGGGKASDRYDPFQLEVTLALAGGLTTVCQSDAVMKVLAKGIDGLVLRDPAFVRLTTPVGVARVDLRERLEKARRYLLDLREYEAKKAAGERDLQEPKKDGVDETHLKLLRHELPARFEVDGAEDMATILGLLDDYRFDAVFSGALEAWTMPGEIARRGVRCIVSPRRRQAADERNERPSGSSAEAAAILRRGGVEFCLYPPPGFDGGEIVTWDGIAGRDLQTLAMDAAWAIRGGLDEQAALESITIAAARILGVDHRVGSIEPGKDADLIVTDGSIFDFRTFVQTTIVNGVVQYEKAKSPLFSKIRPREAPPGEVPASAPATKPESGD
ncbi:MAG TPA: amidohydrolase family protein [Planctomycetota bacterium]|nr:amidohydrolase family protein [Planctomycetota bacterium]